MPGSTGEQALQQGSLQRHQVVAAAADLAPLAEHLLQQLLVGRRCLCHGPQADAVFKAPGLAPAAGTGLEALPDVQQRDVIAQGAAESGMRRPGSSGHVPAGGMHRLEAMPERQSGQRCSVAGHVKAVLSVDKVHEILR